MSPADAVRAFLPEKQARFRREPSIGTAVELLSVGVLAEDSSCIDEAARFVLGQRNIPPSLERFVRAAASKGGLGQAAAIPTGFRSLRALLRANPRDVIARLELARLHFSVGNVEAGIRALGVSLALAPNHRMVLRCAARGYLHVHDFGTALKILRDSPRTRHDPWLIAAEVAVSDVAGRAPRFAKQGRVLLAEQSIEPHSISELASSLGTIELCAGATKVGKRLIERSLQLPNDNTLAQAVWIERAFRIGVSASPILLDSVAFEATALRAFFEEHWKLAYEASSAWFDDERISTRAVLVGTYAACVGLDAYEDALRLVGRGLAAAPRDPNLRLWKAFCLANVGKTDEAEQELDRATTMKLERKESIVALANRGLIRMRQGRFVDGEAFYRQAIDLAGERTDDDSRRTKAIAAYYFAREAILAKRPIARGAVAEASSMRDLLPNETQRRRLDALREQLKSLRP